MLTRKNGGLEWIEITPPLEPDLTTLANERGIHPLAVEDCLHRNQRSKYEDFEVHQFLVIHAIRELEVLEFQFVIFPKSIILVTDAALPKGSESWYQFLKISPTCESVSSILYQAMDQIVDMSETSIRAFYDRLALLESQIFTRDLDPRSLLRLKHQVGAAAPRIAALPSVIKQWTEICKPEGDLRWRWRDVWDHAERNRQAMETFQQQSASALDIYWGWTSKLVNDQMERLTALAAVFLPLTFWTGFFGTNFQIMPYGSAKFFYLSMCVMVTTVAVFYLSIQKGGYFGKDARRRRQIRYERKH
ncbi:MAG: magnesium transporter CorA family protein [Bdellovibrionia bacterium]